MTALRFQTEGHQSSPAYFWETRKIFSRNLTNEERASLANTTRSVCWGQQVLQEGQAEQWDERLSVCMTMHLLIIPHLCRSSCLRTSKLCPSLPTPLTLSVWFFPHLKKVPHTTNSTPTVHTILSVSHTKKDSKSAFSTEQRFQMCQATWGA